MWATFLGSKLFAPVLTKRVTATRAFLASSLFAVVLAHEPPVLSRAPVRRRSAPLCFDTFALLSVFTHSDREHHDSFKSPPRLIQEPAKIDSKARQQLIQKPAKTDSKARQN